MSAYTFRAFNLDTGAYLGDLVDWLSVKMNFEYSAIGSMTCDYPRTGRFASLLSTDIEIVAYYNNVEPRNGRWIVRGMQGSTVDDNGGKTSFVGLGWLDALRKVLVYTDTTFTNATPGAIIRTLLQTATTRGAFGAANTTTSSFNNSTDSKGNAWANNLTITYSAGTTYRQILEALAQRGIVDFEFDGRDLRMYNGTTMGTARDVVLAAGRHVLETPFKESTEDRFNVVLMEGDDGVLQERSVSGPRREEGYQQQSGVKNPSTLNVLGDAVLASAAVVKEQRTTKVASASPVKPIEDFIVGDSILYDDGTGAESMRVRQIVVEIDNDDVATASVVLNDRILEDDIKRALQLNSVFGGVSPGSIGTPTEPLPTDTTVPNAPASVTATSAAYTAQDGRTYTQATVFWTPVTTNTDATAIDDLDHYEVRWKSDQVTPAATPAALYPARQYDALSKKFDRRGKGYGWLGADGGGSTRASGGKDFWLFSDTNLGQADQKGKVSFWTFIRNSAVVTDSANNATFTSVYGLVNKLTTEDATLATGLGGWRADTNCTITRDTAADMQGAASLRINATAAGDAIATTALGTSGTAWYAVTAGLQYTVMAHYREVSGTARAVRLAVRWYTSGGAVISTTESVSTTNQGTSPGGTIFRRRHETFTAPAGAARATVQIRVVNAAASQQFYVDCIGFYQGDATRQSWNLAGRGWGAESLISPESLDLVGPGSTVTTLTDRWLWTDHVWTQNGKINAVVSVVGPIVGYVGDPAFNFEFKQQQFLVQWDATTFAMEWVTPWTTSDVVSWGTGVILDASYTYIYGLHDQNPNKHTYIMRVPAANVLGTKEWWTGSAWSTTRASAASILTQTSTNINAFTLLGGVYQALYIPFGSAQVKLMTASNPQGPWTDTGTVVYTIPEMGNSSTLFSYFPRIHRQFDSNNGIVMSYSVSGSVQGLASLQQSYRYAPKFMIGPVSVIGAQIPAGNFSNIQVIDSGTTTAYFGPITPGSNFIAQVRAVDNNANASTWTDSTPIRTAADITPPEKPSDPIVAAQFRGIRVEWDGFDQFGNDMPGDFFAVEVHVSEVDNFEPTFITRRDTFYTRGGVSSVQMGMEFGITYYVKLVAYDTQLNRSAASNQASVTTEQLSDPDLPNKLITGAKIADQTIFAKNLTVASFSENLLPNGTMEEVDDNGRPFGWEAAYFQGAGAITQVTSDVSSPISGTRSLKEALTAADSIELIGGADIPVVPGDVYYVSAKVRTSRTLIGGGTVEIRAWTALTANKLGAIFDPDSQLFTIGTTTGGTSITTIEGQFTVPANFKFATIGLRPLVDTGGAYDVWFDDVQLRRVVGTANIANASINSAKIALLAVDDARIASVSAGKITVGTLIADITVSARIKTADTGNRVEMNSSGIYGYTAGGASFNFQLSNTGSLWMRGTLDAGTIVGGSATFPNPLSASPGRTQIDGDGMYATSEGTTNLVTRPSGENTTGIVTFNGASVTATGAAVTDYAQNLDLVGFYGKKSLKVQNTTADGYIEVPISGVLTAGQQYTYSFHAAITRINNLATGLVSVYANFSNVALVERFSGGGSRLLTQGVDTKIILDGPFTGKYTSGLPGLGIDAIGNPGWQLRWAKTFTAPGDVSGTSTYWLRLPSPRTSGGGNETTYAVCYDGIQFENKAYMTRYCDGDQPGCSWSGTAHASTSSRVGVTGAWFPAFGDPQFTGRLSTPDLRVTNTLKLGSGAPRGTNYAGVYRTTTQAVGSGNYDTAFYDVAPSDRVCADDGIVYDNLYQFVSQQPGVYVASATTSWTSNATGIRITQWYTSGGSMMGNGYAAQGIHISTCTIQDILPGNGYWIQVRVYQNSGVTLNTQANSGVSPNKAVFCQVA